MIYRLLCRWLGHVWVVGSWRSDRWVYGAARIWIGWKDERCIRCGAERTSQIPDPTAPKEPGKREVMRAYQARR